LFSRDFVRWQRFEHIDRLKTARAVSATVDRHVSGRTDKSIRANSRRHGEECSTLGRRRDVHVRDLQSNLVMQSCQALEAVPTVGYNE
jgi:hypothetical protein